MDKLAELNHKIWAFSSGVLLGAGYVGGTIFVAAGVVTLIQPTKKATRSDGASVALLGAGVLSLTSSAASHFLQIV